MNIWGGKIRGVFNKFLDNYLDVPMPDFNSGVFEGIEFEAIPERKWFGKFPSIFGFYRQYTVGDDTSFKLKIKRKGESGFTIKLILRLNNTDEKIRTFNCPKEGLEIFIEGISLPSETTYLLESTSNKGKLKAIVNIVPFNKDALALIVVSSFVTFLCMIFGVILAWVLGFIEIIPALEAIW